MEKINQQELEGRITKLIPSLQKKASTFTRDIEEADDLFQETFVKIWTNKHKYVYDESLRAWCYKIMYNTYIDTLKKSKKTININLDTEEEQGMQFRHIDSLKEDSIVEDSITIEDIHATISEELSNIDAYIVTMILSGYKQQEIADKLGLQRNNVKQHYFQAIRKVRAALSVKFNLDSSYGNNPNLIQLHKEYRLKKAIKESKHRKKFEE